MAVVMERETSAAAPPMEYKVLATRRTDTLQRELSAAAAEGFRMAAVTDHPDEGVLLLERTSRTADRLEYSIALLSEATAGTVLTRAEADGYRAVVLLDNELVLQRSRPQSLSLVTE